jgi:hypothetical protein
VLSHSPSVVNVAYDEKCVFPDADDQLRCDEKGERRKIMFASVSWPAGLIVVWCVAMCRCSFMDRRLCREASVRASQFRDARFAGEMA